MCNQRRDCISYSFLVLVIDFDVDYQVNGDSLFMTGNFKEFNVENQSNSVWDEHNAVASTAVCILFSSYIPLMLHRK